MCARLRWWCAGLCSLILLAACGGAAVPTETRVPLTKELVLRPLLAQGEELSDEAWKGFIGTIDARLDGESVEHAVRREGDLLVVAVPADANQASVVELLTERGLLELIDPQGQYLIPGAAVCTSVTPRMPAGESGACGPIYETIVASTALDPGSIELVRNAGQPNAIQFRFLEPAATQLKDFTAQHIGLPLSMVVDGRVIFTPRIMDVLPGAGVITAASDAETQQLFIKLKYGALPHPLELVEVREP